MEYFLFPSVSPHRATLTRLIVAFMSVFPKWGRCRGRGGRVLDNGVGHPQQAGAPMRTAHGDNPGKGQLGYWGSCGMRVK